MEENLVVPSVLSRGPTPFVKHEISMIVKMFSINMHSAMSDHDAYGSFSIV